MNLHGVELAESDLAAFCRRHQVRRLFVYGSILGDRFRPTSDVDFLVEFQPGRTPGMFEFGRMILELEAMVGRPVDLRTPFDLSPYFRTRVLEHARLLHAA